MNDSPEIKSGFEKALDELALIPTKSVGDIQESGDKIAQDKVTCSQGSPSEDGSSVDVSPISSDVEATQAVVQGNNIISSTSSAPSLPVIASGRKHGTLKEVKERLYECESMLLKSVANRDICAYFREHYDISSVQTQRYIAKVYARWRENIERRSKYNLDNALAQRELLIEKCIAAGDYKTASALMSDRDKLLRLYDNKVELDVKLQNPLLIAIQNIVNPTDKE